MEDVSVDPPWANPFSVAVILHSTKLDVASSWLLLSTLAQLTNISNRLDVNLTTLDKDSLLNFDGLKH